MSATLLMPHQAQVEPDKPPLVAAAYPIRGPSTFAMLPAPGTFPGVSRVFAEGERLGAWKVVYAGAPLKVREDDVVVFGAWHSLYPTLVRRLPCRKVVLWTSPLAQSEMSGEEVSMIRQIRALVDRHEVDKVWCASPEMVDVFSGSALMVGGTPKLPVRVSKRTEKAFHAPYPLSLPEMPQPIPSTEGDSASLFCPAHPRKNLALQMLAARRAGLNLHMNIPPFHEAPLSLYTDLAKMLGLEVDNHGWMTPKEYLAVVASMEIGLQWSHPNVESFNYVAWDHLALGVPVATNLRWANDLQPGDLHSYDDGDKIPWPDSLEDILEGIGDARQAERGPRLRARAGEFAKRQNAAFLDVWKEEGVDVGLG